MEHHELLQLIDDLSDERARARFREGIWMALFAHLVFFALLYFVPAWIFHGVKIINPIDAMRQHDKEIYLDLPPEVAKNMQKQHNTAKTANKALDQKTIQQLQKMQQQADAEAAARAAAQPQPTAPPPPQEAKNEPQLPMPEAPHPQSNALPDMPMPQNHAAPAQANNESDAFNNQIRSAAHAAIQGNGNHNYSGSVGPNSRGVGAGMQILTDTQGVDFGPYMERLHYIVQTAWDPLIPESVKPPLLKQGVVGIRFTIDKSGKLAHIVLETPSGDVALDKAAWGAIIGPQPFPPLPHEFPGKSIEIRGAFLYNTPLQ